MNICSVFDVVLELKREQEEVVRVAVSEKRLQVGRVLLPSVKEA